MVLLPIIQVLYKALHHLCTAAPSRLQVSNIKAANLTRVMHTITQTNLIRIRASSSNSNSTSNSNSNSNRNSNSNSNSNSNNSNIIIKGTTRCTIKTTRKGPFRTDRHSLSRMMI